jgi:hypothetical protein
MRSVSKQSDNISHEKAYCFEYLERNAKAIATLNDSIFYFAELGMQEIETAKLMTDLLEQGGFKVERGISGFASGFCATCGSGGPVIAIHTEYDANPDNSQTPGIAEASMNFERTYRMYGAITAADQRQRFGNYFDFFWRAKRPANVTVRLEYRQEKLRSFVQAREMAYTNTKGNHKTEFTVIGDDYLNDGRVISWRCLLIENGRIVAENRSYLWE